MRRTNYLIKVILILSAFFLLECTQLGGGIGEYSDVSGLEWKRVEEHSIESPFHSESFQIVGVRPDRIFTPNGDSWNDYFEILYYNPYDALVSGKIYDIKGRLVAKMEREESKERLTWDGNDLSNNPVTGGLYIYQVEVSGPENKLIKGIIILVR